MAKTLYLIDGSGFIFRAYHALPALTNKDGVPIGAVLGFVNMLLKLMDEHKADYVATIFDASRITFRNRIYPEYKAHRPPAPDDLVPQFAIVREATEAMGLPAIELEDYEADDIIATYARQARAQGMEVVIISSDKDLMQLIGDGISMFDAMKQKTIGHDQVMEKFGVPPEKVRHVLSLIGDSSDNVPGVPGIGPKTAAELINAYETLEGLLARAQEIPQAKRRETITTHSDKARLSYELIGLKEDVPLPVALDAFAMKPAEHEKLFAFLQKYGLKSVLQRLQQKLGVPVSPLPSPPPQAGEGIKNAKDGIIKSYTIVRDEGTLVQWLVQAAYKGAVAFDTETTSLDPMQAELVGFSLCVEPGKACYVPLAHKTAGDINAADNAAPDLFSPAPAAPKLVEGQLPLARAIELIKPLLEDESVTKIGHNIKYDMLIMRRYSVGITPVEDSMLLSYALHAGEHGQGMDELSERYLKHQTITYDDVTGTGRNRLRFDQVEIDKAGEYAAEDADITLRLYQYFKPQLFAAHMLTLYDTIERPLIPVLAKMEATGVRVDPKQLAGLSADFAARMREYEREIYALAGHEFNIGSPKQLGEVLFEKLQLGGGKKSSKTGAYGTDSSVLEELAEQGHPLPAKVIEWRQLAKLKSTYSDALAGQINPQTHRVHTCYAMAATTTGRLSSTDPNLQNIPIRTVEGKKIRQAFVAMPGYKLLSADYSQIELRLLAHMADIPTLKEAFRNGDDIHAITASQMFGVAVTQIDPDLRRKAKTINFGIIYGISAHGLAVRLGIGRGEAATYIDSYFKQYPGIRDYMEVCKTFARDHGYVKTLFGRRCHVPGILDKNPARRQFSERAAINAPLQGTAADIIKRAMVGISSVPSPLAGEGGARNAPDEGTGVVDSLPENKMLPPSPNPLPQGERVQGERAQGERAQGERAIDFKMLLQVHDELVFEVKDDAVEATQALVKRHMEGAAQLSVPLTVETGTGTHWGDAH